MDVAKIIGLWFHSQVEAYRIGEVFKKSKL